MAGLLRAHDITPTHQRIEIAYALFSRQEHLSADQIMAIVNDRHSETSKATVYNTLNLFKQHKLVREVIVDPSKVFYDPNTGPHHHFYNLQSGELIDIDARDVQIQGLLHFAYRHGHRRGGCHYPHSSATPLAQHP